MRTKTKIALSCLLLVGLFAMGQTYNEPLRKITQVVCGILTVNQTSTFTGVATFTASPVFSDDITMENGEKLINSTDGTVAVVGDDDAVEQIRYSIRSTNTAGEDNNTAVLDWSLLDDGAVLSKLGEIVLTMTDETSNTLDASMTFRVPTNDTLASELVLLGASLSPFADGGLDLGNASEEYGAGFYTGIVTADGLRVDDALSDIGGGSYSLANGDNDLGVAGDFEVAGQTNFDGNLTFTTSAVSLTSPTATISAVGKTVIVLNSDANQTGHTLTGGLAGQIVTIVAGSGSNTMQFDDNGETLALGANKTLTEGQGDTLTLLCVNGTNWSMIGDGSGN